MQDLENAGPNNVIVKTQRQLFLTLLVDLIQTVSLFANFHVTCSVIFRSRKFSAPVVRSASEAPCSCSLQSQQPRWSC